MIKKIEVFFGSQVQDILAVYRRYNYLQSASLSLASKQEQLAQQTPDKAGNRSKNLTSITYQKELTDAEIKRLDNYINGVLQKMVKNTPLEILKRKLTLLTPHFEDDKLATLFEEILELKRKLIEMDVLSPLLSQSGRDVDADFTYQRIQGAAEQSTQRSTSRAKGSLTMRGSGVTHVEADNAIMEVPVNLSGEVNATFNIEATVWSNRPIAKAIQEEAKRWLNWGRRERHKQNLDSVVTALSHEIQQMTDSIRKEFER